MSSAEVASGYVRRMVESETRGWGDTDNALARLEATDLEREASKLAARIAAKKAARAAR